MCAVKLNRVKGFNVPKSQFTDTTRAQGFPETKPDTFPGSLAEYYIYVALTRLIGENNFDYQHYEGVPATLGSISTDFVVYNPTQIAIRIQGEYWHYEQGVENLAYDMIHMLELTAQGWTVIDIDAEDALKNPMYFTKEALNLRSHSRIAQRLGLR